MASARSPRRNPYRPGTASYAQLREATLRSRTALAQANAARSKASKTRRRLKKRASAAKRALREIETREEFRSRLTGPERSSFDRLPIRRQDQLLIVMREYPDTVPRDIPDPFIGSHRDSLWRLSYASRAGIRQRAVA
jgi:hypothetical protein